MQPHSICAIMLSHYIWNSADRNEITGGQIAIEYRSRHDLTLNKYYKFDRVELSSDRTEIKAYFSHMQGSTACEVKAIRSSMSEGSRVDLYHSEQHASGLREEYNLYKNQLSGSHRNSLKYRNFSARMDRREDMRFVSEVRLVFNNEKFKETTYNVRMVNVYEKKS